jgi:hypothetical protein
MRALRALLVAFVTLAGLWACGGAPAQIVDYSPLRGAQNIPTTQPVKITFDHAVDQQSVSSRLHLSPDVAGSIRWLSPTSLEYDHPTLSPNTTYEVIIEAGYRDAAGNSYVLRHHWSFTTEASPTFAASSPADGATRIDPADYLTLDFTHTMNPDTLRSAISFSPDVSFSVRLDPTNDLRAIVAPNALLDPSTGYTLLITTAALDVDGNQLDHVHTVHFTTGPVSTLHHWIAFATLSAAGDAGGLWIVNESGFPRELLDAGLVQSFHWSPDGSRVVYQSESGDWSSYTPGEQPQPLDFSGSWSGALVDGEGYAYLDASSTLYHEAADRSTDVVASNVAGAAVSPDGRRIAYTQPQADGTTLIWGYDVSLRSHYVLANEKGEVAYLAWAPDGARLAYLRTDAAGTTALRVLGLSGSASISTVATGQLGPPQWLRDSDHVVLAATVQSAGGFVGKAFVINVAAPPASLTASLGLPADSDVQVADPTPSPDGHQIAFISGNQVWLMNADGTRPTPLTRYEPGAFPYSCLMPAWTRS